MRAPLSSRSALLGDFGVGMGAALGGRPRRARIDERGRNRWPSAGATLDLDFINNQGYVYGQGIGRMQDLLTISGGAGGTVVDRTGTIVAANAPRFDYDPVTLACKGLLVEEQRTNQVRNNTMAGAVVGVIGSGGSLPTGWTITARAGMTYEVVSLDTVSGQQAMTMRWYGTSASSTSVYLNMLGVPTVPTVQNDYWTTSIYARRVAGTGTLICYQDLNNGSGVYAGTMGPISNVAASTTWARLSGTAQVVPATAASLINTTLYLALPAGVAQDLTFQISLPQVEFGAFATSTILTTSAAVTRTADAVSIGGQMFVDLFNPIEGTFDASSMASRLYYSPVAVASAGNAYTNSLDLALNSAGTPISPARATVTTDGVVTADMYSVNKGGASTTGYTSVGFAYAENDYALAANGTLLAADPVGARPRGIDRLRIGSRWSGNYLDGWIAGLRYWPRRLSSGELQDLTR